MPYGCQPDQGLLDDESGLQLLVQSLHAGGDTGQFGDGPVPTSEQVAAALAQPGARTAVSDLLHRRPSG